jgi:hypothetical protein
MENWSSIRDSCISFIRRWRTGLQIYGIGFLLMASALYTGRVAAAMVIFGLVILAHLMHRYGEPYRRHGEAEFARRRQENHEYWDHVFARLRSRLQPDSKRDDKPAGPAGIITTPGNDDRPESPAPMVETPVVVEPPRPPVTHET